MKKTTIGILAGMGPRSTSPFLELVLDECQSQYGAVHDIDYPHMIIYALPTPFYIDREIDELELKASIAEGLKRLEGCGVDLIAVPCNSAHIYFDHIVKRVEVPVLNMIDQTVEALSPSSKVTLFATETTHASGLYQKGLSAMSCEYYFDERWQPVINDIILKIKSKKALDTARQAWNELIDHALEEGIEKIIIACTDLNMLFDPDRSDIAFIDSSKSLARGLIRAYLEMT